MEDKQEVFTVYILRTARNTLYIGQTKDLEKRLKQHQNKTKSAAKYTRAFGPIELVYTEEYPTLSEALKREYQLKQLTKKKKEELIKSPTGSVPVGCCG